MKLPITTLAALSLLAAAATAAPLQGTVTEVYDGETVLVQPVTGLAFQYRLAGIDAPESCQDWNAQAKEALTEWVRDRLVTLQPAGRGEPSRKQGKLVLEGADINARMVSEGHAWSTRTRWDQGPYVKQERQAKALGRGLHGQGGAVMPSEFRRTRTCP
jgi:endonuclease YncB( thermonuclease family)